MPMGGPTSATKRTQSFSSEWPSTIRIVSFFSAIFTQHRSHESHETRTWSERPNEAYFCHLLGDRLSDEARRPND